LVQQGGGDVGGGKAFFEEALDQVVLALAFAGGNDGPEFFENDIGPGFLDFALRGRFSRLRANESR
jgi:hypothetical protein